MLSASRFFLISSLFSVIIVSNFTIYPFVVGKIIFFRAAVELALLFFLFDIFKNSGNFLQRAKILFRQPIVIAITFFVICFSLAGIFGYDFQNSFWSNFVRGEGIFQMLHYYIFFLLLIFSIDDEKSWRKAFIYSLLAGLLMIILGLYPWLKNFTADSRFGGAIGNAAFASSYLLFSLFYLGYLRWFYATPLVLFFLFFTGTRGTFLGLATGVSLGGIYFIFSKLKYLKENNLKKFRNWILGFGILFGIWILVFGFLFYLQPFRIFQISLKEQTAQTRFWTWGSAWKGFMERPLLGWGPENFSEVFNKYFDKRHAEQTTEVWFDRAHNTYIDYLTTTGILGLFSYLLIWIIFYYQLFKSKVFGLERILFFSLPVAYLIQNLLIFETLPSYINLFIFLAFSAYKFQITNHKIQTNNKFGIWSLGFVCFLVLGASLYFGSYRPFIKSILINNALAQVDKINSAEEFKNNFSKAIDYYSPYGQDEALKVTGSVMMDLLKKDLPREVAVDLVNFLNDKYQPVLDRGRGNNFAQNYYILGKINSLVGNKEEANKYYKTAFKIWPSRPEFTTF